MGQFSDIIKNENKEVSKEQYMFNVLKDIKKLGDNSLTYLDGINSFKILMKSLEDSKDFRYTFKHEMEGFLNEIKGSYGMAKDYKLSTISLDKSIKDFRKYMIEKYELEEFKNKDKTKNKGNKMIKEELKKLYDSIVTTHSVKDLVNKFVDTYDKLKDEVFRETYEKVIDEKTPDSEKRMYVFKFIRDNDTMYNLGLFQQNQKKENKHKEPEITKQDLITLEDTEENKEFNEILKVFHQITKPHIDSQKEITNISEKENGILNALYKGLGKEEFLKLTIKWNPYIGLFIESKDGFDKDNQKLIMSHTDLVHPFQKLHQEIKDGKKESGLTIGSDGLIRGSLDNTLTNAIVLKNFIDGKFESNVSILLDRGEESGMWGANNFHKEKKQENWYELKLNGNALDLIPTQAPIIKKDLVVINTDVTMGYDTPYAFETKDFSKETDNKIKEMFPAGDIARYGYDDSASQTNKENITMSYCITVGTSSKKLGENKYQFSGGCHSENTMTTIDNIVAYSKTFEPFVRAYGNEIKLELKKDEPKLKYNNNIYLGSEYEGLDEESKSYLEQYTTQNKDFTEEELKQEKTMLCEELLDNSLNGFDKNAFKDFNKANPEDMKELYDSLNEYCSALDLNDFFNVTSKEEIIDLLTNSMTDIEVAQGLYEYYGEEVFNVEYEDVEDNQALKLTKLEENGDTVELFVYKIFEDKFESLSNNDVFDNINLSSSELVNLYMELKEHVASISLNDLSECNTIGEIVILLSEKANFKEIKDMESELETNGLIF